MIKVVSRYRSGKDTVLNISCRDNWIGLWKKVKANPFYTKNKLQIDQRSKYKK